MVISNSGGCLRYFFRKNGEFWSIWFANSNWDEGIYCSSNEKEARRDELPEECCRLCLLENLLSLLEELFFPGLLRNQRERPRNLVVNDPVERELVLMKAFSNSHNYKGQLRHLLRVVNDHRKGGPEPIEFF
ncbi:hypothetical protein AB6A40_002758 [Gnathostoma spinigerum]|uniref:Uncharacterized protein n=1 Tax=Gnathostoma spinigerum TaxID=75299 RepID=A0ABD6E7H6_9BILA